MNKEKQPVQDFRRNATIGDPLAMRMKDVSYYYIDYREFANVTKYRLAMMRKGIEGKLMKVSIVNLLARHQVCRCWPSRSKRQS